MFRLDGTLTWDAAHKWIDGPANFRKYARYITAIVGQHYHRLPLQLGLELPLAGYVEIVAVHPRIGLLHD